MCRVFFSKDYYNSRLRWQINATMTAQINAVLKRWFLTSKDAV
jgi:hypothetical protein